MIYKVIGNFTDENFEKIIIKISSKFKFMYCNDTLYVSMKSVDSLIEDKQFLYKVFRPAKNFFITEITEQTILKEDDVIGEWCKDNFVLLEKQRYEKEQQAKLKKTWIAMDNMEQQLKSELLKQQLNKSKNKKGGS